MATEIPGLVITGVAGESMTSAQYYGTILAADGAWDIADTPGNDIMGVIQNNPAAGAEVTVMVSGVSKMVVGTGGVTVGDKVQCIADGITTAASGDHVVGRALATGVAGDIVSVLLVSNHLLA